MALFRRPLYPLLIKRLQEPRRFLQVLAGPRQSGKTTLIQQVMETVGIPTHYASADQPTLQGPLWIEQQWEIGRMFFKNGDKEGGLLILDEVQKIPSWSEFVKRFWDEDSFRKRPLKVVLLGSAPLLIQRGLTESLAGRFEILPVTHWSYAEMKGAFGWNLEQFVFFGGYPGAADLISNEERWVRYVLDALIETTLSRDILLLNRVDKPALLRRLFQLGCHYSGRILSYQKMMGQLQDAGNTTTLAHYLELLSGAWMVTGLAKYAGQVVRQKGSSPKLQVLNNALMTAQGGMTFAEARKNRDYWGRLVESAVGAHLVNSIRGGAVDPRTEAFYWREGSLEVDFILRLGKKVIAIEVKSGCAREALPGIEAFSKAFRPQKNILVGGQGIDLEQFLLSPLERWISD